MSSKCAECGIKASNFCAKCRKVYYCSKDCQTKNWKLHKKTCCQTTLIKVNDLDIGRVHYGRHFEGEIQSKPFRMSGVHFEVADGEHSILVSLYNYPGYDGNFALCQGSDPSEMMRPPFDIQEGQRVRITDPFCKYAMDGQVIIRVDDFSKFKLFKKAGKDSA